MYKIKNLGFGLTFLLLTSILNGCSSVCTTLPPTENPIIVGGYTKLISFNYLVDTNITNKDSRIKTLEMVASQNPSAKIIIRYNDKAGQIFAKMLNNMFKTDGYKSIMIAYKSNVPYTVDTYINFKPLDQAVSQMPNKQESMVSVFSNINSGSDVNDTINIKDSQ